jgi:hypothetical protein
MTDEPHMPHAMEAPVSDNLNYDKPCRHGTLHGSQQSRIFRHGEYIYFSFMCQNGPFVTSGGIQHSPAKPFAIEEVSAWHSQTDSEIEAPQFVLNICQC